MSDNNETNESSEVTEVSESDEANKTTKWTVGHGGNGRWLPLELKRHFAWVFSSESLPVCIDNEAVIEIEAGREDVYMKRRELTFKLQSAADIKILAENFPLAASAVPANLPEGEWGYLLYGNKDDKGLFAIMAASIAEVGRVVTFFDNSANFALNANASKIETLGLDRMDRLDALCAGFGELPVFIQFSLTGAEDPIGLTEKIVNDGRIRGISVINDISDDDTDTPKTVVEMIGNSGFKGFSRNRVFVGYRDAPAP